MGTIRHRYQFTNAWLQLDAADVNLCSAAVECCNANANEPHLECATVNHELCGCTVRSTHGNHDVAFGHDGLGATATANATARCARCYGYEAAICRRWLYGALNKRTESAGLAIGDYGRWSYAAANAAPRSARCDGATPWYDGAWFQGACVPARCTEWSRFIGSAYGSTWFRFATPPQFGTPRQVSL